MWTSSFTRLSKRLTFQTTCPSHSGTLFIATSLPSQPIPSRSSSRTQASSSSSSISQAACQFILLDATRRIPALRCSRALTFLTARSGVRLPPLPSRLIQLHRSDRIFPAVNRLDRLTSGLMFFALNAKAANSIISDFIEGRVRKEYLARVRGKFPE